MQKFSASLRCNWYYYTGSTRDIELRLQQHQAGEGSLYTKQRLPVKLLYVEEFPRIDEAFYHEKQVQGWSRKKKLALMNSELSELPGLSIAYHKRVVSKVSTSSTSRE